MLFSNGFLITGVPRILNHVFYKGIENNPWPLDRELLEKHFCESQLEWFDRQTDDLFIGEQGLALIDLETSRRYLKICEIHHQSVDVKYIEVIRNDMIINERLRQQYAVSSKFLGYDVGQCSGDYYSSILADVIARPRLLGNNVYKMLNSNGSLNTTKDANVYLQKRNAMIKQSAINTFECGQMDTIAVYSATIDS